MKVEIDDSTLVVSAETKLEAEALNLWCAIAIDCENNIMCGEYSIDTFSYIDTNETKNMTETKDKSNTEKIVENESCPNTTIATSDKDNTNLLSDKYDITYSIDSHPDFSNAPYIRIKYYPKGCPSEGFTFFSFIKDRGSIKLEISDDHWKVFKDIPELFNILATLDGNNNTLGFLINELEKIGVKGQE